jgi:hypothetical protein
LPFFIHPVQRARIFMNKTRKLKARQNIELVPLAPFNFDASLHKPDHFPAADTRREPGVRWQTTRWQGHQRLPLSIVSGAGGVGQSTMCHRLPEAGQPDLAK